MHAFLCKRRRRPHVKATKKTSPHSDVSSARIPDTGLGQQVTFQVHIAVKQHKRRPPAEYGHHEVQAVHSA